MRLRHITAVLCFFTLVLAGTAVHAGPTSEIEGVTFGDVYRAGDTTLPLRGLGLARYLFTVKVYVAALYIEERVTPDEVLSDVPKRLELQYFQPISGPDFGRAAAEVMARNVPAAAMTALRPKIDRLHALYQDVKPGDRYSLTYLPGVGTELAHNGTTKGTIEGADFASAYFAIWLGPHPISEALKSHVLQRP